MSHYETQFSLWNCISPFFLFDLIAFSKLNFEVDIAYAKYNNKALNSNKKITFACKCMDFLMKFDLSLTLINIYCEDCLSLTINSSSLWFLAYWWKANYSKTNMQSLISGNEFYKKKSIVTDELLSQIQSLWLAEKNG